MEDYRGTVFADDVVGGVIMQTQHKSLVDLEKEIIPKNSNMVKPRKKRTGKITPKLSSGKVDTYSFSGTVEPFKNALHFVEYYRAFLRYRIQSKMKFDNFSCDAVYASQILDLLNDKGRSNKIFLNAWLYYFCEHKLKGNKSSKIKYTSIKAFKESFIEYNCRHMDI